MDNFNPNSSITNHSHSRSTVFLHESFETEPISVCKLEKESCHLAWAFLICARQELCFTEKPRGNQPQRNTLLSKVKPATNYTQNEQ